MTSIHPHRFKTLNWNLPQHFSTHHHILSPPKPVEYLVPLLPYCSKYPVPCENTFIMFNWAKQQ